MSIIGKDTGFITINAARLSALLDATANLADYVGAEGRDPDSGIMVARETAMEAHSAIVAAVMAR